MTGSEEKIVAGTFSNITIAHYRTNHQIFIVQMRRLHNGTLLKGVCRFWKSHPTRKAQAGGIPPKGGIWI